MPIFKGWRGPYLFLVPLVLFLPFLYSVSQLHRETTPGVPERKRYEKYDHLVLGPAAGHVLPTRLQCRGLKAMNKIHASMPHRELNFSKHVVFVTVFTIYSSSRRSDHAYIDDKSSTMVTIGNKSYDKTTRSMAILNTFIDFIQTFLEMRLDHHTERMEGPSHYVFTDSDVAVVHDLGNMFEKYPDFHLALTFRNNKEQPLNSGFIAVKGTKDGISKAKIFLQEVLDVYSSKYTKASRMLGDQLALAYVVKSHLLFAVKKFVRPEVFSGEVDGASILFLPCAVYNWTPPEGAGQFHGMPLDVQVVHFKGSRKRLMLESWNFFNSTSNMSDMLCLILKSGRTKYDF